MTALALSLLSASLLPFPQDGLIGSTFPGAKFAIGLSGSPPRAADLDGDGHQDLAIANSINGASSLSVLFGRGDGTFEPVLDLATGNQATEVAIADIDGDGDADLLCGAVASDVVTVHRNLGARQFAAPDSIATGAYPIDVILPDVNGDGVVDLVVAAFSDSALEVRLGAGDGTFAPPLVTPLASNPYFVDAADVNGDGVIDLLITYSISDDVEVRLGDGLGGFASGTLLPMGDRVTRALFRDGSGDGTLDIVAAQRGVDNVCMREGAGDGTFGPRRTWSVGDEPQSLEVADLDGDGAPDFVATRESTFGQLGGLVVTRAGDGTGPGGTRRQFRSGSNAQGVAIRDFDGDGALDLAVTNGIGGDVAVFLGMGDGRFERSQSTDVGVNPRGLFVRDFSGDGQLDIVTTNFDGSSISYLEGDGSGEFPPTAQTQQTGIEAFHALAGDLNGDGRADLVLTGRQSFTTRTFVGISNGDGTFSVTQTPTGLTPSFGRAVLADLDGDGHLDVVGADGNFRLAVWLGGGNGTFSMATSLSTSGSVTAAAVGDVDGDGDADVVVGVGGNGPLRTYFGDGTGSLVAGPELDPTILHSPVALGEFTGDGVLDLVYAGGSFTQGSDIEIATGVGDGSFVLADARPTVREPREIKVLDLDLDGLDDIAVIGGGVLVDTQIFRSSGDGLLHEPESFAGAEGTGLAELADLNGDGNPDLVNGNGESNDITIHLNRSAVRLTTFCEALPNSTGEAAAIGSAGTRSLARADFRLRVGSVPPGEFVTWFSGGAPGLRTLPGGNLCIAGTLTRNSAPLPVDSAGNAELAIDFGQLGIAVGSTRYFQCWYSDANGPARLFNFSNGLAVLVAP